MYFILGGWRTSFTLNANESMEVSLPLVGWVGIFSLVSPNSSGLSMFLYISYNADIEVSGKNIAGVTFQHASNSNVIKITNGNYNSRQFILQRISSAASLYAVSFKS